MVVTAWSPNHWVWLVAGCEEATHAVSEVAVNLAGPVTGENR